MADLFQDKAADYDTRPVPQQISEGVVGCLLQTGLIAPSLTVLDFGAGTGLISSKIASHVKHILAVDVSPTMLEQLAKKPELEGKASVVCQNILEQPLDTQVDIVVSAMAMHHVEDTQALMHALSSHLLPGGRLAVADLDQEEGDFHAPNSEGVFHAGFDRSDLEKKIERAGFTEIRFVTACHVDRNEKHYPVFLVTAVKPA